MRLGRKQRPHFVKRELGFLFCFVTVIAFLLVPMGFAISSVIKMPRPLPDIVKSYKSVTLHAGSPGMKDSGVQVKQGDYITILAKGAINVWPKGGGNLYLFGPRKILLFRLGETNRAQSYTGPDLITIRWSGEGSASIYLGYRDGEIDRFGNPRRPDYYLDNIGALYIDIIVWKTNDPNLIAKFFGETSLAQPKDETLREIAQEFKRRQEVLVGLQEKTKEVEGIKKELSTLTDKEMEAKPMITPPMEKEAPEVKRPEEKKQIPDQKVAKKEEEKPAVTPKEKEIDKVKVVPEKQTPPVIPKPQEEKKVDRPLKEEETARIKEDEKDKRIVELSEKLKKALQVMKELEEMKEVLARLDSLEEERLRQPKNLPVIAVASPKDGITVDSEYVTLFGVAEHQKGISKFEVLLNNKPVHLTDQGNLQLMPKDRKRAEFSERIRLREGQNTISIVVQGTEGLTNQKNISIQLAKKREEIYSVVIGINKYKNLPSLKYATNDAREFYRYLVEVNQVPRDHIWLLLDEEATLEKLRSTLGTSLRRTAGKDDTVIIFLAGHGATEKDSSSPDGDGLEKYILPHNADLKDLYASALPMSDIARIFQRISSERLVFISDTCYSGASGGRTVPVIGTRANLSGAFLERLSQGKGRVILTASDANEVSAEKDELKHGVFTYYLLEGLRGKADLDGDGVITVDEVYHYVSMKVPQSTGQDQHPVKKGETTGQIVLGVVR